MLDILTIRERLNELPFQDGKRQVLLTRVSEKFPVPDELPDQESDEPAECPDIIEYLDELESELSQHDLLLWRDSEDRDRLYVVQRLKRDPGINFAWIREAMGWVSKLMTVALEMVIPGVIGLWLDRQLGTSVLALAGFAFGAPLGIWHLIHMTRVRGDGPPP